MTCLNQLYVLSESHYWCVWLFWLEERFVRPMKWTLSTYCIHLLILIGSLFVEAIAAFSTTFYWLSLSIAINIVIIYASERIFREEQCIIKANIVDLHHSRLVDIYLISFRWAFQLRDSYVVLLQIQKVILGMCYGSLRLVFFKSSIWCALLLTTRGLRLLVTRIDCITRCARNVIDVSADLWSAAFFHESHRGHLLALVFDTTQLRYNQNSLMRVPCRKNLSYLFLAQIVKDVWFKAFGQCLDNLLFR